MKSVWSNRANGHVVTFYGSEEAGAVCISIALPCVSTLGKHLAEDFRGEAVQNKEDEFA